MHCTDANVLCNCVVAFQRCNEVCTVGTDLDLCFALLVRDLCATNRIFRQVCFEGARVHEATKHHMLDAGLHFMAD